MISTVRTLAVIQARLGSTRLPAKVARLLGDKPLLAHVVQRALLIPGVDQVVVASPDTPDDRRIRSLVPADVPVVFGSEHDVLGRFLSVLDHYPADAVVRICADNPYIDPEFLGEMVSEGRANPHIDYLSHRSSDGRPVILSPLGLFGEWCRTSALRLAASETTDPADREHVTRYLYRRPDRFTHRLLPLPPELDRDDLRLTVDSESDFQTALEIHTTLSPSPITWRTILPLLQSHPHLPLRMSATNRLNRKS